MQKSRIDTTVSATCLSFQLICVDGHTYEVLALGVVGKTLDCAAVASETAHVQRVGQTGHGDQARPIATNKEQ